MVPPVITDKLSQLRQREKVQSLAWGLARVLAVVLVVLLLACAIDWVIDRYREVPPFVQVSLLIGQGLLLVGLLAWLVLPPAARSLPDDTMALWVEEKHPRLGHRLISAVQLNRPGADREGMSPELIGLLTREAEAQVRDVDLNRVVDNRRWGWSAAVLGPALILFVLPFLIWPEVFPILLGRQFLSGEEIPRGVYLHPVGPAVWPSNETAQLKVRATGPEAAEHAQGELVIRWDRTDLPQATLPLKRVGQASPEGTYFVADLPASSVGFTYTAFVGDGRLREPASFRYVPRPEVREEAYVQLPESCGTTPEGTRYENPASAGDVEGIPGSWVRVHIKVQKAIKRATLHLFTRGPGGIELPAESKTIPLEKSNQDGDIAFPLLAPVEKGKRGEPFSRYTVEVVDEHGFDNRPRPSRTLRLIDEPKPEVVLLPEQFLPTKGGIDSRFAHLYIHTGMPALEGGKIRIGYRAFGPYGLGKAVLQYRKLVPPPSAEETSSDEKAQPDEGGSKEVVQGKFRDLILEEEFQVEFDPRTGKNEDRGPFLVEHGVFEKTSPTESVRFHAVPSQDPARLGRFEGGGRYDLELKGLLTPEGNKLVLQKGDQLEYRVVIYADRAGTTNRPWNVSESRITRVEDFQGLMAWMTATRAEQDRIRELEKAQRALFEKEKR